MSGRMKIKIAGHEYVMCADESEEYMNAVGALAQQVVTQCGGSADYGSTRALILATINLADQTLKAQQNAETLAQKLREYEMLVGEMLEPENVQSDAQTAEAAQKEPINTEPQADAEPKAEELPEVKPVAEADEAAETVAVPAVQSAPKSTSESKVNAKTAAQDTTYPPAGVQEDAVAQVEEASADAPATHTDEESLAEQLREAQERVALLEKEKKSLQGELTRSRSRNNKRR